ncbi:T9SS type A sorting domain-containing protein [Parvicella tangerina]|uniref:T9SS C-terminal target domain-containing protein n=1 Tax=Parvicella tangerina TaxID=2829795 RepID=A0A916JP99_9FLAO|nr:T9SS type A sorting domain-containing protein [Parvicella tangerina]CAG5084510.1 hypothetical protein CRYO30217_02483 [Parvicella tangerina]
MNKSRLILGTTVLAAIAGGVFLSKAKSVGEVANYEMAKFEKPVKPNSWNEARAEWEMLHANIHTGKVEQSDYINAKKQALAIAQAKDNGLVFNEVGPDNIGGRTRAIEIDPNDDNLVFAGSVSGGLFVSTDQGNNWERVQSFDDQVPVTVVSSIAISNNSTIYVGCGFNDFSDGGFQTCEGIYYSTDGGTNWTQLSTSSNDCVNKIVADRSQNDVIYYTAGSGKYLTKIENASTGSPVETTFGSSNGIGSPGSAGRDIKVSPDGQHILYLSSNRVYVSNDFGANFTENTSIGSGMNRLEGAISFDKNSNGKYNMAIVMSRSGNWGGAYFSDDNGVTWSEIAPYWQDNTSIPDDQEFNPLNSGGISPQGNYNLVCSFVPGDPNTMIFGGIDLYRWRRTPNSNPVAGQFEQISFWYYSPFLPKYVHADNHRLTWSADGKLFVGNDGGIQKSLDTSLSIFSVANKGYNVTQFYGIDYGPDGEAMGGSQDNGTLYNDNPDWNLNFLEVSGGDGFECELSQLLNGAFVSTIYSSQVYRARSYTSGIAAAYAPCGTGVHGQTCGSFHTYVRLFEDENDTDTKDSIEYYTDTLIPAGTVINYQSSNFDLPLEYTLTSNLGAGQTINLPDPIQSLFVTSTGTGTYITRDIWRFGSSLNYNKISSSAANAFEFSKDGNTLWMATGSSLYRITNLDSAYTPGELDMDSANFKLDIQLADNASWSITDISVDANDPNKVAYTVGGAGGSANIFYSDDAMSASPTFTAIDGNLPTYVAYGIELVSDPSNNITAVVGTAFGPYLTTSNLSGSVSWSACNLETGVVPTYDVKQQWRGWGEALGNVKNPGRVYVGTFGRGIWASDDIAGTHGDLPEEDVADVTPLSNVSVYPNPLSNDGNLKFVLANQSDVEITFYNLQGQSIKRVNLKNIAPGSHSIAFSAQDFAAGTYLVAFSTENHREVKKFIKK